MKRILNIKTTAALISMLLILGVGGAFAQKKRPVLKHRPIIKKPVKPVEPLYTVDKDTIIRARMNSTLSSKTAVVGSTFTSTVTEPVYSSTGVVVMPTGSVVTGRVDAVTKAANEGKAGQIAVSFTSVRLPNGRKRTINGSLTDLTADKTTSDNEGTAKGKEMEHRKVIFIGGGAAGGAILGAAIGGGKGALIGGILGGAGGFIGDRYTKGKDAEVKSGTEFSILLNQSISLPRFVEATTPVNQ